MDTSHDSTNSEILVLGLGNILLTDEAVGVRALETLKTHPEFPTQDVKLMDGGTMGMTLMVDMEDAGALIIIDAAQLQQPVGTVQVFEGNEMDHFLRTRGRSPHDIGLDDIMDGLRLRSAVPQKRALIGIQPKDLRVGETLTPAVEAALPQVADSIISLISRWNKK
ncbi:HyaD/HybD family hydrogenase maturation endopeptidase [Magnetovibrio sp. PR-2]|uniref:HyaD/HybD family hydrogenase maturation endopeptidase n=1 Tax=Magnetovibrio sp. PR-2 TaxID=3120356 RepID=UPI002FCDEA81